MFISNTSDTSPYCDGYILPNQCSYDINTVLKIFIK